MVSHAMIGRGAGVVVGVSGGPDSVALVRILGLLSHERGFWLAVAHLDHGLRAESAEDAAFVENLAQELGVECLVRREDIRDLAVQQGVSIEEAGRRARYALFDDVRARLGAETIATAHHRDDAVETFFLRILRGTSIQGLGGIRPKRERIIRPLIAATRAQILEFLDTRHIPYRIDASNLGVGTDRNFIRNRLLPVIAERFPDFSKTALRSMSLIRQEEAFLDRVAAGISSRAVSRSHGELALDTAALMGADRVVAARVLLAALYDTSGPGVRWKRRHVEAALAAISSDNPSSQLDFPDGITLTREYDRIRISRNRPSPAVPPFTVEVDGPGIVPLDCAGMRFEFRVEEGNPMTRDYPDGRSAAVFDADQVPFPLTLRSVGPGDRFRPWGLDGARKVKKILIDLKVPVSVRRTLPLLVKGSEILWIPGIRRSSAAPVGPETRSVLEVRLWEQPEH